MLAVGAEQADTFISPSYPELRGFAGSIAQFLEDWHAGVSQWRPDETGSQPERAAFGAAKETVVDHLQGKAVRGRRHQGWQRRAQECGCFR
jgi:hypothetical protein